MNDHVRTRLCRIAPLPSGILRAGITLRAMRDHDWDVQREQQRDRIARYALAGEPVKCHPVHARRDSVMRANLEIAQ